MKQGFVSSRITNENIKRKNRIDAIMKSVFTISTMFSSSIIIVIVVFILYKGISPFINEYTVTTVDGVNLFSGKVNFFDFITGLKWAPPTIWGVGFMIVNTVYISLLSLLVAVPIGTLTALFIGKIAPVKLSHVLRTSVELLASVPSIIYGVFGGGVLVYVTKYIASVLNIKTVGGLGTFSTVLLLSMMILPTITTVAEVSIRSVSKDIEQGSLALGATKTQTNFKVVLPSAKSGIFAGAILGVGRALGEATAVTMVAGQLSQGPTFGLFTKTRTITSTMLQGLHESIGLNYDIRFSLGIVLMITIIITNIILTKIKNRLGNIDV